jgi:hypothetical protein
MIGLRRILFSRSAWLALPFQIPGFRLEPSLQERANEKTGPRGSCKTRHGGGRGQTVARHGEARTGARRVSSSALVRSRCLARLRLGGSSGALPLKRRPTGTIESWPYVQLDFRRERRERTASEAVPSTRYVRCVNDVTDVNEVSAFVC